MPDSITVHGGIIEGRHRNTRRDRCGDDPAERVGDARRLGADDGNQPRGQRIERIVELLEPAAEGEAIIAELGHEDLLPPSYVPGSTASTGSACRSTRSASAAISSSPTCGSAMSGNGASVAIARICGSPG
eukprot:GHVU01125399.1.p1 GENE.GHVU01125399.1~~GHVU01125399.1.p1  ORF type:complete len:142 (-),score=12.91 GHVU01125399.1:41-433(-)